ATMTPASAHTCHLRCVLMIHASFFASLPPPCTRVRSQRRQNASDASSWCRDEDVETLPDHELRVIRILDGVDDPAPQRTGAGIVVVDRERSPADENAIRIGRARVVRDLDDGIRIAVRQRLI